MKRTLCCTDIIILILFLAFWGGMIFIAAFAISKGDVWRLVYGYDSFGNTCNKGTNKRIDNVSLSGMDTARKEYLIYFDIFDPLDAMQLCIEKCPDKELKKPEDVKQFYRDHNVRLCRYDIDPDTYENYEFRRAGPCPELPIHASFDLLNRCVPDPRQPTVIKSATDAVIRGINADDIFRKVLADLYNSWREMLGLCIIGLVLSLIMVFTIRFLATVIIWVTIILAVIGSIVGTAFLWWTYAGARGTEENLDIPVLTVDIRNETAFLVFAIIATIFTVILLLILLVMRKHLTLVVALFHEAGKCIGSIPMLLLQPIWTFIALLIFFTYWIIIMGYISTAGKPVIDYDKGFKRVEYEEDTTLRAFWWYHVVGLIWTAEFILGCQKMVIAGAVGIWYFTRNKDDVSCNTVGKSIWRLVMNHMGSVAFGALIITIIKLPKLILMYIHEKFKDNENKICKCCIKCCICCLACIEKVVNFVNMNAYIVIIIEGKSFCPATARALKLIVNNLLRVSAVNSVGDFVLFLGKIAVMIATAAIGILWFKTKMGLHYYPVPVLLVCVFAFFIAHSFFSIYETVVDTLLLCFCEDSELNRGATDSGDYVLPIVDGKGMHASGGLRDVLEGYQAPPDEEKDEADNKETEATETNQV